MTFVSSYFRILVAILDVRPFPGLVPLVFDANWSLSDCLLTGKSDIQGNRIIAGRLRYADQGIYLTNHFSPTSVAGIIGENGTGKSTIIRALGRGLCGSMGDDEKIVLLIWETAAGVPMMWQADCCNITVEGVEVLREGRLPACNVVYCDQVGAVSGRPLLDSLHDSTPFHNLYDCSQLAYLHKDAAIAAVPSPRDHDMDGSSTVAFSEVIERHRVADTMRIARAIQRMAALDADLDGTPMHQAYKSITGIALRPRSYIGIVESMIASWGRGGAVTSMIPVDSVKRWLSDGNRPKIDNRTMWWMSGIWHEIARNTKRGPHASWARDALISLPSTHDRDVEWARRFLSNLPQGSPFDLLTELSQRPEQHGWTTFRIKDGRMPPVFEFLKKPLNLSFMDMTWAGGTEDVPNLYWLSSGERAVLSMLGRIYNEMFPHDEQRAASAPVLLLVDELESSLHPAWQRQILSSIVSMTQGMQLGISTIFVATHSPLVVSELPSDSVVRVVKNMAGTGIECIRRQGHATFGQSPDAMLREEFGLEFPLVGQTALSEISDIIKAMATTKRWDDDGQLRHGLSGRIDGLGDIVVRSILHAQLDGMDVAAESEE